MHLVRTILRETFPRGWSLVPAIVAVLLLVMGALLCVAMVLDPLEDSTMFGASAVAMGVIFGPLAAVLLAVAGLLDRRSLGRGLWFLLAAFLQLGLGTVVGLVMAFEPALDASVAATGDELGTGIFGGVCCGFVPACFFLVPGAIFAYRGVVQALGGTTHRTLTKLVDLLASRGAAQFDELARDADIPVHRVEPVLLELRKRRHFPCRIEARHGWVCTQRYELDSIRRLSGLVASRGRVSLDELERELRAPEEVVRSWIQEAVRQGELYGYIDWKRGLLWSRHAEALRGSRECPNCAGQLELVGRGVVVCPYCDAEIFL